MNKLLKLMVKQVDKYNISSKLPDLKQVVAMFSE